MKKLDEGNGKAPAKDKTLPGFLEKFKKMDPAARDRLVTRGITVLVACAVAGYALFTMLPERRDTSPDGPGAQAPAQSPSPGSLDPEQTFTGASGDQAPMKSPGAGGTEPDAAITDQDGYAPTGGKTLYAIGTDGGAKFEIRIPLGYGTYNSAGGTYVKPEGMDLSADGNEPLYFSWGVPSGYDSLMERGGIDFLSGQPAGGVVENEFRAIDYYTSQDVDGNGIAVVLARRTVRHDPGAEYPLDDTEEYYILVDCGGPLAFMGRISGYALDSGLSRRYPTLNELARAMIAPADEPGFPPGWDMAEGMEARADDPLYGEAADGPADETGDAGGQEPGAGTDGQPPEGQG